MRTWGWLLKRREDGGICGYVTPIDHIIHLGIILMFVAAGSANSMRFNSYHPYADHLQFLNDLQAVYPSNSEIVVAGNSDAGCPITGIRFYGSGGAGSKPTVVIHKGVHAREWGGDFCGLWVSFWEHSMKMGGERRGRWWEVEKWWRGCDVGWNFGRSWEDPLFISSLNI
jgi:hypothetical protein